MQEQMAQPWFTGMERVVKVYMCSCGCLKTVFYVPVMRQWYFRLPALVDIVLVDIVLVDILSSVGSICDSGSILRTLI